MHIKALENLFIPETGQTIKPGETLELPDDRAKLLIDRGAAESVTAREAAKLNRHQEAE